MNYLDNALQQKDRLPDKPSELIRIAIQDLEKTEQSANYAVTMSAWHEPDGVVCEVCLAGAVMAFSLKADADCIIEPEDFSRTTRYKLSAIDHVRVGNMQAALKNYESWSGFLLASNDIPNWVITPYENNREQFKEDLKAVAADLAKVGL